jgi:hypothetical protein
MSVLVWDGVTLATDLASNDGRTLTPVNKIWKKDNAIYAGIGPLSLVAGLRRWYENGADYSKFPQGYAQGQFIVVRKSTGLTRYSLADGPVEHGFNAIALGTGRDFAYGALAVGADARAAVEAANKYCTTCGLGVQSMSITELEDD